MNSRRIFATQRRLVPLRAFPLLMFLTACHSAGVKGQQPEASASDAAGRGAAPVLADAASGTDGAVACEGLCKQQVRCAGGQETTVTGTVLAPTPARFGAADPLYNALVYVPSTPLAPFPRGVSCDRCGGPVSGSPLVQTVSGPDGRFELHNVPAGDDIPLVIQIGRWRRQVKIPKVAPCTRTPLSGELTRLPRNQSEGDIPRIAVATGTYDPLECLMRKIGIDDAEFTLPDGAGRVHFFPYGGNRFVLGSPPTGDALTSSQAALDQYDLVVLPCDSPRPRSLEAIDRLRQYTGKGGRLFLTDLSHVWLLDGGAFENVAKRRPPDMHSPGDYILDLTIDQSFPKGKAFAEWLKTVKATNDKGGLTVREVIYPLMFEAAMPPTQPWLLSEQPRSIQHFTFNTPVGAPVDQQCGRVVYSNFHVAEPGGVDIVPFPETCAGDNPMTPQEKALEFMLFDASSCLKPVVD